MKKEIRLCDLCHNHLLERNGIFINFGQSLGGWGRREDPIYWSGEVCSKCYEEFSILLEGSKRWLELRKDSREPEIKISEHEVSFVWKNKSSSDGHKGKVLRELS